MSKTYSQVIFGRKGVLFEGIDQSFDTAAETNGRVQYAMDIDFLSQTLKKRYGYAKYLSYGGTSVMGIQRIDYDKAEDTLAVLLGDGVVKYISEI